MHCRRRCPRSPQFPFRRYAGRAASNRAGIQAEAVEGKVAARLDEYIAAGSQPAAATARKGVAVIVNDTTAAAAGCTIGGRNTAAGATAESAHALCAATAAEAATAAVR